MLAQKVTIIKCKTMETNEIIKRVIEKTFASLNQDQTAKICNDSDLRIVYPHYRNKDRRISEQELKQTFIYFLQKETRLYYSVETPTKKMYRFSGKGNVPRVCEDGDGQSANIDLSIYETLSQVEEGQPFVNIEFKNGNPKKDNIKKDLLKLYKEPTKYGYFLHIVESSDEGTWKSLATKFKCQDIAENSENKVTILVYSLSEQRCLEMFPNGTMK